MAGAGPPEIGAELIREALDSLADPLVLLGPVRNTAGEAVDFRFVMVNRAACAMWRLPPEQLVGSHLLDLLPGPTGRRIFDIHRRVLETGEPLVLDDVECSGERFPSDGDPHYFEMRVNRIDDAILSCWSRDVTDRVVANNTQASTARQLRHAVDSDPGSLAVVDSEGRFLEVNRALESLLGRDGAWLHDHRLDHILVPGDRTRLMDLFGSITDDVAHPLTVGFLTRSGDVTTQHLLVSVSQGRQPGEWMAALHAVGSGPDGGRLSRVNRPTPALRALLISGSRPDLRGHAISALLERDEAISVTGLLPLEELPGQLAGSSPDIVMLIAAAGPAGEVELGTILDALPPKGAPGVVVVTNTERPELAAILGRSGRPHALLNASTIHDARVLPLALQAVHDGLVAFDPPEPTTRQNHPGLDSLTGREREVLALVSQGLDNAAIADLLVITVKAVENFVGSIFKKLGLSARTGINRRTSAALLYVQAVDGTGDHDGHRAIPPHQAPRSHSVSPDDSSAAYSGRVEEDGGG